MGGIVAEVQFGMGGIVAQVQFGAGEHPLWITPGTSVAVWFSIKGA
jgi:hypothetical protein